MKKSNNSKPIRVLSLFDGLSAARIALDKAGVKVDTYFASEIDPYATQIASKNYPDTIHLGDIREIDAKKLGKIDLVIGGSPCQDLSIAGSRLGLKGKRSNLFFEFLRLVRELKPKYFLLENVASMKKSSMRRISKELEVEPVLINSSVVSAQSRKRFYWTNVESLEQPKGTKQYICDILANPVSHQPKPELKTYGKLVEVTGKKSTKDYIPKGADESWRLDRPQRIASIGTQGQNGRIHGILGKSVTVNCEGRIIVTDYKHFRPLSPLEVERLQTIPDNYTQGVSKTQRFNMLGNAFTVEVIAHILSQMDFSNRPLSGVDALSLETEALALDLRFRFQNRMAA